MKKYLEIAGVIVLVGLSRLLMTMPNFEPIGALAIFGGAFLGYKQLKFIWPILALLIGDLIYAAIVPSYSEYLFSASQFFVYASYIAMVWMGGKFLGNTSSRSNMNILGVAVAASLLFFLVTNFGAWMHSIVSGLGYYPANLGGLISCYAAGLAFYKGDLMSNFFLNGLISTTFFTFALMKAYSWIGEKSMATETKS